jgi:hypothetical protein
MSEGNSSYRKSAANGTGKSTEKPPENFAPIPQANLFSNGLSADPGSMNDGQLVKSAVVEAIRRSGKTRESLADQMSALTGMEITVRRINGFTAESREDLRFPLELVRAFCVATGDFSILRRVAELAGFRLVDAAEWDLLELGKEFLRQKRATEKVAALEARLRGVEL